MGTVLLKRVEEQGKATIYEMNGTPVTYDQYIAAYHSATKLKFKGAVGALGKIKKSTIAHEAEGVDAALIIAAPVAEAPETAEEQQA